MGRGCQGMKKLVMDASRSKEGEKSGELVERQLWDSILELTSDCITGLEWSIFVPKGASISYRRIPQNYPNTSIINLYSSFLSSLRARALSILH